MPVKPTRGNIDTIVVAISHYRILGEIVKQFSELSEADQQKMIKSLEEIMLELLRKSPVVWQREKPKHDAPNAQH